MNITIDSSGEEGLAWGDVRAAVEMGKHYADEEDFDLLVEGGTVLGIRLYDVKVPTQKPAPVMRGGYGPSEGDWRSTPQVPGEERLEDVLELPRPARSVSVTSF